MIEKNFSIKEAFKFGINKYIDNFGKFLKFVLIFFLTFIVLFLISAGISVIIYKIFSNFISSEVGNKLFAASLFFIPIMFSTFVTGYIFYYELIRISLDLYNNKEFDKFRILEIPKMKLFKFIIANTWFFIKVFFGFLLLIFPGFYILSKYYFTGISIVEKDNGICADKKYTKELTKYIKLKIFGFAILIYIAQTICSAGIITIILSPIFTLAIVYAYKKLSEQVQAG